MPIRKAIYDTMHKNPALVPCLNEARIDRLVLYWELLQRWGSALNLSRRKDAVEWAQADVADSFLGLAATGYFAPEFSPKFSSETQAPRAMDIGSGAGFPGVALAMLCESSDFGGIQVRWIESLHKRVSFLKRVGRGLQLPHVEACPMRVEEVSQPADWVTVRATFPWQELHLAKNCVAPGGTLMAFVGREPAPTEWQAMVDTWGWASQWVPYEVEGLGPRAMALATRPPT